MSTPVLVYGASGHTGRFVVRELVRRGLVPVLAGRSAERLAAASPSDALAVREVGVDEPDRLREAVADVGAVINCAGPFLDTALPLARAAVAAGAHYLDVTAEQPVVRAVYDELDGPARAAGVAVVPAMAFYGGLADLLLTAVLDGARAADEVDVAIALDHWWPTEGTRATGARNTVTRQVVRGGHLVPLAAPAATATWAFPPPFEEQAVVELPLSEVMTVHRHLQVGELRSWLTTAPLEELRDARTPPPTASDDDGRSAQRFVVDVAVRRGSARRRITASGRDIYAISAPIVVEGVARLLDGRHRGTGALAPGQAFDAADLLQSLTAVDAFATSRT
ncbi:MULTISPECIES: trans-acting enoyl reductase family protein [unclassified Actinotalea]|uniref:saccharopine dehydrogenase family protein n=1 Tax=unclassified Actinotalea TaxID=2638618 RepID=UPI0015F3E942|nr:MULTISPECIES: saccharopine dehydrogenase NADP-binding domain-containing protein [unclassified Actinotalea]